MVSGFFCSFLSHLSQHLHRFQLKDAAGFLIFSSLISLLNEKIRMVFSPDFSLRGEDQLDPVGSGVRYEMMKLCTGSV